MTPDAAHANFRWKLFFRFSLQVISKQRDREEKKFTLDSTAPTIDFVIVTFLRLLLAIAQILSWVFSAVWMYGLSSLRVIFRRFFLCNLHNCFVEHEIIVAAKKVERKARKGIALRSRKLCVIRIEYSFFKIKRFFNPSELPRHNCSAHKFLHKKHSYAPSIKSPSKSFYSTTPNGFLQGRMQHQWYSKNISLQK